MHKSSISSVEIARGIPLILVTSVLCFLVRIQALVKVNCLNKADSNGKHIVLSAIRALLGPSKTCQGCILDGQKHAKSLFSGQLRWVGFKTSQDMMFKHIQYAFASVRKLSNQQGSATVPMKALKKCTNWVYAVCLCCHDCTSAIL